MTLQWFCYNHAFFFIANADAESDVGGEYLVYNRWGRVGVKGQDKMFGPYNSQDTAVNEFEQKFFAKTRNQWSNRREFTSYPKCYTWLEMDYSTNEKEESIVSCPTSQNLDFLTVQFVKIFSCHEFYFKFF